MAFGSLATIKPTALNKSEVLYTAPAGQLVEGKVYIVNQSSTEIKIRIGLSTGGLSDFDSNKGYIVFNKVIPRGEYYETDPIYFADQQSVVVRANHTEVAFTLLASETENREEGGFLAQSVSQSRNSSTIMFTIPTDYRKFRGNLYVCNRGSFDTKVRVGLGSTPTDYLEYNYLVERDTTHVRTDLRAAAGDILYIKADQELVNFVLSGYYENFIAFSGDVGIGSTLVTTSAYVKESVSIGITDPGLGNTLKVIGNTELAGLTVTDNLRVDSNVNVGGVSTFTGTVTFSGGTVNTGVGTENAVVLDANVNSNVTPGTTNTFDLGQGSKKWRYVYSADTIIGNQIDLSNGTSGIATIGRVGAGATQTQVVIGAATTAVMASGNIAANGDLIVKGQIGVGTVTTPQLRGNTATNNLEVWNSSLSRWIPIQGVDTTYSTLSNNATISAWTTVWADTSGGTWTLTLPASPQQGDKVRIVDVRSTFDSNNLTVGRNSSNIMGDSSDMVVSTEGASFELIYSDATQGWVIFSI